MTGRACTGGHVAASIDLSHLIARMSDTQVAGVRSALAARGIERPKEGIRATGRDAGTASGSPEATTEGERP